MTSKRRDERSRKSRSRNIS
jgi:hypothetical protein